MAPKKPTSKKPANHAALNQVDAEWQEEDYRLFGFSVNQTAIPTLVLVQSSSRMPDKEKHLGQIYNTLTRKFSKETEIMLVGWNTPRAVLPFPFSLTAKQLCASPDGIEPMRKYVGAQITAKSQYEELALTIPEACEDCPLVESSLCTQMYRYFGMQLDPGDDPMPFSMRLKRTALDAGRKLNFILNRQEIAGQFTTFIMSTQLEHGDSNDYYVPVFEQGRPITPQQMVEAVQMNRALSDKIKQANQGQLEAGELQDR